MNGHGVVKKEVNDKWESENYSGVEKNPTVSWNEIAKHFGLLPLSLSNVLLRKASILEQDSRCGAHSEKRKNMKTSPNEELKISFQIWLPILFVDLAADPAVYCDSNFILVIYNLQLISCSIWWFCSVIEMYWEFETFIAC
jgi:hypothetical protein